MQYIKKPQKAVEEIIIKLFQREEETEYSCCAVLKSHKLIGSSLRNIPINWISVGGEKGTI